ncbi:helix-turn-helix domain-containing protein [Streptomyces sp. NPDC087425]|uniref:helix-turn-helix domain-containing protein n=1 Tax=Streptomyces sp. NPDC087425 TaxID=3365787 RepID=UPI00380F5619
MTVDDETGQVNDEADEPGWEVDPDDAWGLAVLEALGRQLRMQREQAGIKAAAFGRAIGYGEAMVYKVEGGRRIPKQAYLLNSDKVLKANGVVAAMWEDFSKVRYPKTIRKLGKMESKAIEIGVYECNVIHGLLQTPEYARAVIRAAQPPYSQDDVERMVSARLARQSIFEREPIPSIHFVLEEAPLHRQVGGTMVWRRQLERLLEVGELHNTSLQVMPTNTDAHPGLDGKIELLKFPDGSAVGRADGVFDGRPTKDPKDLRIIELQYGTIRAQAYSPRETQALIEQLLGET